MRNIPLLIIGGVILILGGCQPTQPKVIIDETIRPCLQAMAIKHDWGKVRSCLVENVEATIDPNKVIHGADQFIQQIQDKPLFQGYSHLGSNISEGTVLNNTASFNVETIWQNTESNPAIQTTNIELTRIKNKWRITKIVINPLRKY